MTDRLLVISFLALILLSLAPQAALCEENAVGLEEQLKEVERKLVNKPNDLELGFDRAWLLRRLNRESEALSELSKLERRFPKESKLNVLMAESLAGLKRYDEAIRTANRAIELSSSKTRAYFTRGGIYFRSRQFESCISDLTSALKDTTNNDLSDSEVALALYSRALAQYKLNGPSEMVVKDLTQSLRFHSNPDADKFRLRVMAELNGKSK